MNEKDIKRLDREYVLGTYKRYELVAERGKNAVCTDAAGREYIDFAAGIGVNSLGFCNEAWVNAVSEQAAKLQHISNLFYTEPGAILAETLCRRTGMKKVFFSNSGAEANECAMKAARKYGNQRSGGKRNGIITLYDSFHGRTLAAITATGQDGFHKYFTPLPKGFTYCTPNDVSQLESAVSEDTCAIMMELIQGEGGLRDLEANFVLAAQALCKEKDLLLIIDEVQTGIGRTGKFFAYEHYGIQPDMVTFAKGIGGGLPIGGVLFGERVRDVLEAGDHGTTYGGNPVACAGANAVLAQMDEEFLIQVQEKGRYMRERLAQMPRVQSLTGKGLMIGIQLSEAAGEEGETAATSADVAAKALAQGLLVLTAKEKVRLLPPLTISYDEIHRGLDILSEVL